ncbi:MAG: hypothetical protein ABL932_10670 [Terricaulis sp.]
MSDEAALPSYEDLCLQISLYTPIEKAGDWANYIHTLKLRELQFDAYCVQCGKPSTFKAPAASSIPLNPQHSLLPADFSRTLYCMRDITHAYAFHFRLRGDLQKIGQYPSIEDIIGADLQRFKPVLVNEDFVELRKATGLYSHGIGIGSFVYLRRIFERLIYRHYKEHSATSPIADFDKKRMDEKIGALSAVLPAALVKNKAIYSILSVGIHELDEGTCRKHFPAVRAAIIQILEQDLEAKQRRAAAENLEREIAKISASTKKPPK